MLIEIILAVLLGIFVGTITGLTPGLHINLIGGLIVALSASAIYFLDPIYLVAFIVSMAISHTFLDFIPSIFLGCPDTDTELSILPGHQMLKEGKGYEAIVLTSYGSLAAVIILLLISFPSIVILSKIYSAIVFLIPYILILISAILILSEKNKLPALGVFLLSGLLGLSVLNFENSDKFLLPLLTGLFGSSMLLISIQKKTKIPNQKITNPDTKMTKPLIGSLIASPICSFLPGMGSGQAAIIGNMISRSDTKGFLILLGATNTLVMGFSFVSLYIISRTRTGAAVAIQELMNHVSANLLVTILVIVLISGILSFFMTNFLAKFFSERIGKINYTKLAVATLIFLSVIVFLVSGVLGFIILVVSTFTGIYSISLNVRRTNMMGCLIIPVIFFYLFLI